MRRLNLASFLENSGWPMSLDRMYSMRIHSWYSWFVLISSPYYYPDCELETKAVKPQVLITG